jgi:plasmid stability protein
MKNKANVDQPKVRVPSDLYHRLRVQAAHHDRSISEYAVTLLEAALLEGSHASKVKSPPARRT